MQTCHDSSKKSVKWALLKFYYVQPNTKYIFRLANALVKNMKALTNVTLILENQKLQLFLAEVVPKRYSYF